MTRRKSYKDLSLYKCKGRITKSFYTADMKSEDMNNFYLFIESNSKTMNNLKKGVETIFFNLETVNIDIISLSMHLERKKLSITST